MQKNINQAWYTIDTRTLINCKKSNNHAKREIQSICIGKI